MYNYKVSKLRRSSKSDTLVNITVKYKNSDKRKILKVKTPCLNYGSVELCK